jgi:hypothetical protein
MITNDARYTREIKPRIGMATVVFNSNKKTLFNSKLDLDIRKKLEKGCIWSLALCGAESWTIREVEHKCMESFEMWCWRRMEKIS